LGAKIGLIAGSGRLPFLVAEGAAKLGDEIFVAAIRDSASEELRPMAKEFAWVGIAQLGRMIEFFREHGVREVVFAGSVPKSQMYSPAKFIANLPDLRSVNLWYRKLRDRNDQTILRAVAEEFAGEGLEIVSCLKYLNDCLTPPGALTKRRVDAKEMEDIEFGRLIAGKLAGMEVGQSVVVKDKAIIAVEAMEGTDETIRRGGKLARGGAVLVKFSRPGQDARFDIPAAGVETVRVCEEAGIAVIALEAGRTLMLDKAQFIELADQAKMAVHGFVPRDSAAPALEGR
jgi:DUF1009 family protein